MNSTDVRPHSGRLGVLFIGLGAVTSTVIAGVMVARRGLGLPVGSLTQLGTIRAGARRVGKDQPRARIKDALALAPLADIELGAWDIFPDDAYESAVHARVLHDAHLASVKEELSRIRPMPGAFYPGYVRRLAGTHTKSAPSKKAMVELIREDIRAFAQERNCSRVVAVYCASTEAIQSAHEVHASIAAFEHGLANDSPHISNAQLYAWACLVEGVPIANGSPNLCLNFPAIHDLAARHGVPIAGRDFKTGQTMLKTAIAPALKARVLGLSGWYSTNILGNRDGEVLDDPECFKSKEASKLGVLESILPREETELYGKYEHKVRIDYYPPRGDAKEGWDAIDFFGWLGYPMQMKVNLLCRDSILAAPIVLDLALLLDLAKRAGLSGTQEWLGFFFKSPMVRGEGAPVHDLFTQRAHLANALRRFLGEAPIGAEALD
jgi:myo-inositol-1-phosphate synthase